MADYLKQLRRQLSAWGFKIKTEVEEIDALHQTAVRLRNEYTELAEQADNVDDPLIFEALQSCRKRKEEAEAIHMAALQDWENKQANQKSY